MFLDTLTIDPHAPLADRATLAGMAVVHPQQPYGAVTLPRTLLCPHIVVLLSQKIKCDFFFSKIKDISEQPLLPLCSSMCEHMCECEGFLSGVRRAWSWEDGAFVLVDYIASNRVRLSEHKAFCTSVLRVCFARLPHSCVCMLGQTAVFVCSSKLEIRYSPQVQLLIRSQQLFSPARLHPSTQLPPTPPSVFLMLFQLQTFRLRGISLATHTERAYLFHLPPASSRLSQPSFHTDGNSLKFKFRFIGTMVGEKPVLPKQSKLVTDQYFPYFCLYPPPSFCISSSPASPQLESAFTSLLPPSQSTFPPMSFCLSPPPAPFPSRSPPPPPFLSSLSFLSFILFYIFRHLADTHIQSDCLSSSFSPSPSLPHMSPPSSHLFSEYSLQLPNYPSFPTADLGSVTAGFPWSYRSHWSESVNWSWISAPTMKRLINTHLCQFFYPPSPPPLSPSQSTRLSFPTFRQNKKRKRII